VVSLTSLRLYPGGRASFKKGLHFTLWIVIIEHYKTGDGGQKGEKKRHRKTKEDLGGLCDRCGQEETRPEGRKEEVEEVQGRLGRTV
jgi:hypothetical protein